MVFINFFFRYIKCFHLVVDFSYNILLGLIYIFIVIIISWFRLVSLWGYIVTLILTLNKFHKQANKPVIFARPYFRGWIFGSFCWDNFSRELFLVNGINFKKFAGIYFCGCPKSAFFPFPLIERYEVCPFQLKKQTQCTV